MGMGGNGMGGGGNWMGMGWEGIGGEGMEGNERGWDGQKTRRQRRLFPFLPFLSPHGEGVTIRIILFPAHICASP